MMQKRPQQQWAFANRVPPVSRYQPYEGGAQPAAMPRVVPGPPQASSQAPARVVQQVRPLVNAGPELPPQMVWDLPFDQKERKPQETWVRNMHRTLQKNLEKTICHWVSIPGGRELERKYTVLMQQEVKAEETDEELAGESEDEHDGEDGDNSTKAELAVRAFLATGISPDEGRHVLRRMKCAVAHQTRTDAITGYGGVMKHSDPSSVDVQSRAVSSFLTQKVEEQCGLRVDEWVPMVEFVYENNQRTVYLLPKSLPSTVTLRRSVGIEPVVASLADLLDYKMSECASSKDMTELLLASDSYDEYMRREMVSKTYRLLQAAIPQVQRCRKEADAMRTKNLSEKQRREAELGALQQSKREKEISLRRQWRLEDEGKTDRQKSDAVQARQRLMKELEAEPVINTGPPTEEFGLKKVVLSENNAFLVCFQYLDRPIGLACGSGSITRSRLSNLLLCLNVPELRNQGHVNKLLDASLPRGAHIPYLTYCTTIEDVK
ncbi:hypothetical protein DIPPA_28658 [Diplonema papillatum]|nr:hypothetical protein DIPPA_28658 [Diplonema papillatum]